MLWLGLLLVCFIILYNLSQGAPYVPTRRQQAKKALGLMGLPKGAMIVDVGAGDGKVVKAAAAEGYRAVGIELNLLLWLFARLRTRRYKDDARVVYGNAWRWHLPPDTQGVFIFTAQPFAKRMGEWLRAEQQRLGTPLTVVSLGFPLPGETHVKKSGALIKYVLQ